MIVAVLVAASLAMPVAADAGATWPPSGGGLRHLSAEQKLAVLRPLVETANQCIARKVTADSRYTALVQAGEMNGLIVDSVPSCVDAMRALIDAHDRLFGEGAGETYFMGPYLDALPSAVQRYFNGSQ
jgi:hypothetical protein